MTAETFLKEKLQKFSILDYTCVKLVYFFISLLIFSLYAPIAGLGWLFYALLAVLSALPLWIHLASLEGALIEKVHAFLKTNTPSNQVLLFLSTFFATLMICVLCPFIGSFSWCIYLTLAIIFAIKPLTVTWFW